MKEEKSAVIFRPDLKEVIIRKKKSSTERQLANPGQKPQFLVCVTSDFVILIITTSSVALILVGSGRLGNDS